MIAMDRLGGSDRHCWLMRRDLDHLPSAEAWPPRVRSMAFSLENAPQAHDLLQLAYTDARGIPDYTGWLRAWQQDPEHDPTLCYSLYDDLGMIGFIQGWTSAFIKDLVVHPRARQQGLGLQLLNHAFRLFRHRGEAWVDLKVMENNLAARCLYEKAGMRYVQRLETAKA
jgi:ribosomal protein S18 acetylase RimI-like enzyme